MGEACAASGVCLVQDVMAHVLTYVCDFYVDGVSLADPLQPCRTLADGTCSLCDKHGCSRHLEKSVCIGLSVDNVLPPLPERVVDGSFEMGVGSSVQVHRFMAAVEGSLCHGCFTGVTRDLRTFTVTPLKTALKAVLFEMRARLAEHALTTAPVEGAPL